MSSQQSVREQISGHPLFATLPDEAMGELVARCEARHLEKGEVLIPRGEFNYFLYLIVNGAASVELEDGYRATLGAGDIAGEISVAGLSSPIADVVAEEGLDVLAFPIDLISDYVFRYDAFGEKLRAIGSERLQDDEL